MIENICEQIKQVLGNKFVIYYAEKTLDLTEAEKEACKDKVVGVFYVSSGTFKPLQGIQGLEGNGILALLIPTDNQDDFNALQYALNQLVENTNGQILDDGTIYDYVLHWDYPIPAGDINNQYGARRQPYSITFDFVISSQIQFGDNVQVLINDEELTGIITWSEESTINILAKLNINAFAVANVAQFNEYGIVLEALVQKTDLWETLQIQAKNRTNEIYQIEFTTNGITKTDNYILANWQLTGTKSQFQVARLSFVPAALNNVNVVFDGNGGTWETSTTYSLNYLANGGSGSMPSQTAQAGEYLTIATNLFTRSGYAFDSWNTASDGSGLTYNAGDTILMSDSNVDLYAQWNEIDYLTVTYNGNDGTTSIVDTNQYQSGDTVYVQFTPTPTLENCVFAGWAYSSSATVPDFAIGDITSFIISANTTLYAVWNITVIFDGNGGVWEN